MKRHIFPSSQNPVFIEKYCAAAVSTIQIRPFRRMQRSHRYKKARQIRRPPGFGDPPPATHPQLGRTPRDQDFAARSVAPNVRPAVAKRLYLLDVMPNVVLPWLRQRPIQVRSYPAAHRDGVGRIEDTSKEEVSLSTYCRRPQVALCCDIGGAIKCEQLGSWH
jgi:hypothetical protein